MPETEPTAWELMRILRDIREDLRDMKRNSITRDEWALAQQATERQFLETNKRIDGSLMEHKELEASIEAVKKDVKEVRQERTVDERSREKEASQRRFTVAMSIFAGALSVVTGVAVFILQGVFGG